MRGLDDVGLSAVPPTICFYLKMADGEKPSVRDGTSTELRQTFMVISLLQD
jgi:hypothetical protein